MNEILKLNVKMRLKRTGSLVFTKGKKVVTLRYLRLFDVVTDLVSLCKKLQYAQNPRDETLLLTDMRKSQWLLQIMKVGNECQIVVSKVLTNPALQPVEKLKWKGSFSSFVTSVKALVHLLYFKGHLMVKLPTRFHG